MNGSRTPAVTALLFGSGFCALVYQVVWLRELRLIFGASTFASSAVVAIFIGGLGAGSLFLGRVAERSERPLALYARLEAGVGLAAATTPLFLFLARAAYLASGGTLALGVPTATLLRLALTAVVLGPATFLMGGTLPAAARSVEADDDAGRRRTGWLYGANTLGAVTGCLLANFGMIEAFGDRGTLWIAAAANGAVALAALALSRRAVPLEPPPAAPPEDAVAPAPFVLVAAGAVGFAFFLMEIVWYRLLAPLLGGTIFTFGLILAVALAGIGLGGIVYAARPYARRSSLSGFSGSCLLEALALAVPFALGDRIAVAALLLRPWGGLGFGGLAAGWAVIAAIVLLPASLVAGYQFPLLLSLLGKGRTGVASDVGRAYAANTVGAIAGALAAGFGLMPILGAPGCWRLAVGVLIILGTAAVAVEHPRPSARRMALSAILAVLALSSLFARGPAAVWRHSQIGVGRVSIDVASSRNALRKEENRIRRTIVWEADGIESSVAVENELGYDFIVNGKSDGNAILDAPTQVMGGLVGALLHPLPRRALVIGLGTGSTAGWLAQVPSIERVDVMELEPAIRHVARLCEPVNRRALDNPKVHVVIGDARELLRTSRATYDIVFSEPSNPYRAGIASLFTREYYGSVEDRLAPGGLFLQWVQAYDVDSRTLQTIFGTVAGVFPSVETWRLNSPDLLLVATRAPLSHDADELRRRIASPPFREALLDAWRAADLEGVLAHFVARASFVSAISSEGRLVNTDDRNSVEFGFARNVGRSRGWIVHQIVDASTDRGEDRPVLSGAQPDWSRVALERIYLGAGGPISGRELGALAARDLARFRAFEASIRHDFAQAVGGWSSAGAESPVELESAGLALAQAGDPRAREIADRVGSWQPVESAALLAILDYQIHDDEAARRELEKSLAGFRSDPWPSTVVMTAAVGIAPPLAARHPEWGPELLASLERPFAVASLTEARLAAVADLARSLRDPALARRAYGLLEPHVPWTFEVLSGRFRAYSRSGDPRASAAAADLREFMAGESKPFRVSPPSPRPR